VITFANAAVNFTISMGVKLFPGLPPIVPLIPDMLLISATLYFFLFDGSVNSLGMTKISF
jgi:hypothetical protein